MTKRSTKTLSYTIKETQMNTVVPNKKIIEKWSSELRSGKYSQTRNTMHNASGYCCLGVACDVFMEKDKIHRVNGFIYGGIPTKQPFAFIPDWLKGVNNDFGDKTNRKLSNLNDDGYSFDEIADLLELVYVHKAV